MSELVIRDRLVGSVRVGIAAGVPSFVAGSNSGLFTSIVDNGVGDFTLNIDPNQPVQFSNGRARAKVTVEGAAEGLAIVIAPDNTTLNVLIFDDANPAAAADLPFNVVITDQLVG